MFALVIILAILTVITGFLFFIFLGAQEFGGMVVTGFALYGLTTAMTYFYNMALTGV